MPLHFCQIMLHEIQNRVADFSWNESRTVTPRTIPPPPNLFFASAAFAMFTFRFEFNFRKKFLQIPVHFQSLDCGPEWTTYAGRLILVPFDLALIGGGRDRTVGRAPLA